jgi:rhamnosyltransferase
MINTEFGYQALSQTSIIIPTKNAGTSFAELLQALKEQEGWSGRCIIIDSGSTDETQSLAVGHGCDLFHIRPEDFDHGGTRQYGVELSAPLPFIIFMTQDAIPATKDALLHLMSGFNDPEVGACFGRQLPKQDASLIEQHARFFNYPEQSRTSSLADVKNYGIKAAFLSNSFAAYRRSALESVGGFPKKVIFGEDLLTSAKMLRKGWKIGYQADAKVFHSHNYSALEEFKRYFDMGVMHSRRRDELDFLGGPNKEGFKLIQSQALWLAQRAPWLIPLACLRNAIKLVGYRLGKFEHAIPCQIRHRLSMNQAFWSKEQAKNAH